MRRVLFFLLLLAPALAFGQREVRLMMRDPPALTERSQWVFDLRWERGTAYLVAVRRIEMATPMTTPRAMGRFAIELQEHNVLIERARFDFPGMAVPDVEGGVQMLPGLRTRIGVYFPATTRGDKLELVDRTSGQRWALPWPPTSITATDGGALTSDGG